jgi:hypothetical protein
MSIERIEERIARLNRLSDGIFGEPDEVETVEAEELLKSVSIDPARLKRSLYARFQEQSERYRNTGKPLSPLLRQALEDLRPEVNESGEESPLARTATLHVKRLLTAVKNLPRLLEMNAAPVFTAAYRKRTELSVRDKKILDKIAEDLRKKKHE